MIAALRNIVRPKALSAIVAASISVGAPATLYHEGMELAPYYDGSGVKTWCGGETEIGYKEKFTFEECNALFIMRYGWYSTRTSLFYNNTAQTILTPKIHAAFTDMSYNVGLGAVEKSSMIRFINQGQPVLACNAILRYKLAGGRDCSLPINKKKCGGIWTRRLDMNNLCLEGAYE